MRFLLIISCLLLHPAAILSLSPPIPGDSVLIPEPSSFIPSPTNAHGIPTITDPPARISPPSKSYQEDLERKHERDEQDKREEKKDEKDDSNERKARSSAVHSTTDTNGKTVIVTTIIIVSNPDPDQVFRAMGDGDNKSKQTNQDTSTMADPNNSDQTENQTEEELEDSYRRKKNEVRRMVTIASLVGGLGGVAVVTATIILTRVRIRRRREMAAKNIHADDSDSESDLSTDIENGGFPPQERQRQTLDTSREVNQDRSPPEPSAPPAPLSPSMGHVRSVVYESCPPRRTLSMQLQHSAPLPSAPTIKELDGLANGYHAMPPLFQIQGSSHANHSEASHPSSSTAACPHCKPSELLVPPEVPPPAYTPSAPPLYSMPPGSLQRSSGSHSPQDSNARDS
ncbi:hypothetical protein CLU79DRAFT_732656 [Phycomyces nitens]|nr:hypothetical protein CLU79DRAFT_732656 [Phycomyces nitens]